MGSTNMEVEKWVVMTPNKRCVYDDVINSTAMQVVVKLRECCSEGVKRKKVTCEERCGCDSCLDYEFFAIEAALETL